MLGWNILKSMQCCCSSRERINIRCRYDAVVDDLNEIARINHAHSAQNPYSQFRTVYTLDEVKNSQSLYGPVTKLQWLVSGQFQHQVSNANISISCPTSDGAAAAVLVSEDWLNKHPKLKAKAIEIVGQSLVT